MNLQQYLHEQTKGQSRSTNIVLFKEGGDGSGKKGHVTNDIDDSHAAVSTKPDNTPEDVKIMMDNPDNHPAITNIARQALMDIQEIDLSGSSKGACREISSEIFKKLQAAGYNKTMNTQEVALYEQDSISHGVVILPDDGLIIDTQVWQFTGMPYEPSYENPISRKVVFTEDEYKAIGFDIHDNRMAIPEDAQ